MKNIKHKVQYSLGLLAVIWSSYPGEKQSDFLHQSAALTCLSFFSGNGCQREVNRTQNNEVKVAKKV